MKSAEIVSVTPEEAPDAVLHNPDMGWVLYENYPLDADPRGSSTLLTLPDQAFPRVDHVALMFSWQDVEKRPGEYDFTRTDFAYDFWKKRGKRLQLRLSTESLVWWAGHDPPAGKGVPDHVLDRMPAEHKQVRTMEGTPYTVVDARSPFYQERLQRFLRAVAAHFRADRRPVDLIDLRGFGVWGEWHSGFRFPSVEARRNALKAVIDAYSEAFPAHFLALSYSYDPDGPKELYAGPTDRYDPAHAKTYADYLRYSAFDHALTKRNVTFRRDGCGGAVHSNERKLCEEAFRTRRKGPLSCEFLGGYDQNKKGGERWVSGMVDDALSLHPNYVNLLGWQGADALAFLKERPDLVERGLRAMGYRLVPTRVTYPAAFASGRPLRVTSEWVNRGVGRALRDLRLRLVLADTGGRVVASADAGPLGTARWVKGETYRHAGERPVLEVRPGDYTLRLAVTDPATKKAVALPLSGGHADGSYGIGPIRCHEGS